MIYKILVFAPILLGLIVALLYLMWLRSRERSGKVPYEVIEVRIPQRWYRLVQSPPVFWTVSTLTGVSVTVSPVFLFWLGRGGASGFDWRVIACVLSTYLVPLVYMRLGGPVLEHAWRNRREDHSLPSGAV